MLRILLVAAAVVVLIAMLRGALRRNQRQAEVPPPPPAPPAAEPTRVEQIVACAHCGVHLPRGDALAAADGTLFCGEPHRLAHQRVEPPQQ